MMLTTAPQEYARPPRVTRGGGPIRHSKSVTELRRFVFTLNNWTEAEYQAIASFDCAWLIIGKEHGRNHTPHLQGACIIGKKLRFNTLKRHPGFARAHIEPMYGTPQDNLEYCSKEDPCPLQKGALPKPGKRNDLHSVCERIADGETFQSIVADAEGAAVYVKYARGLNMYRSIMVTEERSPPTVLWMYGETGVGKTRSAVELARRICGEDYWISAGHLKWFDGYLGQRVAILDDYRTNHAKFSFVLRLLDRYKLRVEFKGGFIDWAPELIIVTAPNRPEVMWSLRKDEDKNQLIRRCTHVIEVKDYDTLRLSSYCKNMLPIDVTSPSSSSSSSIEDTELLTPSESQDGVEEEAGRLLLDLTCHEDPEIVRAIYEQRKRSDPYQQPGYYSDPEIEFSRNPCTQEIEDSSPSY